MARYGKSPSGNPLTKYVNMFQSPEERAEKYHFARFLGCGCAHARNVRSWHWTKISLLVLQLCYNKREQRKHQRYCEQRRLYYNSEEVL